MSIHSTKAARDWVFTINNPTETDDPRKWDDVSYVTWQLEKGADGVPHLQGYVEWSKLKRLSANKKINARAHWEIRMGTQAQARDYARKEDTRVDGPWELGELRPGQGARTDLASVCDKIVSGVSMKEIAQENGPLFVQYGRGLRDLQQTVSGHYSHDEVRGVWYWGAPGTGKSHTARTEYPDAFIKSQNKWFDGYGGEKSMILDDLDKLGGDKLGHYLKIWADKYSCTGEVKGATVNLQHEAFVVTSNYHPSTLWPDDDELCKAICRRFKIKEFKTLAIPVPKRKLETVDLSSDQPTEPPAKRPKTGICDRCGSYPCFCSQNKVLQKPPTFTKTTDKHGRVYMRSCARDPGFWQ